MVTIGRERHPRRAKVIHAARVGLVVALLLAIPSPNYRSLSEYAAPPDLDSIDFDSIGLVGQSRVFQLDSNPAQDVNGMWHLVDSQGTRVGLLARTLPAAKKVVGYRGPTEAAIVLDPNLEILAVTLIHSADTREHVDAVRHDRAFFQQFEGWPWGGPATNVEVDAVSGATLTSLALAEGVLKRIGGDRPSLVFSDELAVSEVTDWFPDASLIDESSGIVRSADGRRLGRVLRTGPLSDDLVGYQGPTELLWKISETGKVDTIRILRSFDNEPYVDYVRTEAGFWSPFENQSIGDLASLDPESAGIEGVSGATMTSLAIADTIVAAAKAELERREQSSTVPLPWWQSVRWTTADIATIVMLLMTAILTRLGAFHSRWLPARWFRRAWLLCVVVVVGLWSGNLISMALISGWAAEGIAWRLAPGLSAIAAVALLAPPLTKSNPYCNHLCPHGAIQQWIKPSRHSRCRLRLGHVASKWLTRIPGLTLVVAYLVLILIPATDLSSWEPFHAYLFRIASWSAFALALATLGLSAVVPMGYCRLGCPTGRLIDYLRRTAVSDRIRSSDIVATCLLLVATTVDLWF